MNVPPFEDRRLVSRAALGGAAALAATLVGGLFDARRALFAYLTAYTFWVGIAVGALLLLMTWHASRARWPVVMRRLLETIPLTFPLFLVLFVPIFLGLKTIFPWAQPGGAGEAAHLWALRRPYLNAPFFLLRAAAYFAVWIAIGHLLHGWSVRQDREGGTALTAWQRRLGAGGLPLVGLTLTFAAFDWQMSLEADFASTIFGAYFFAGAFLSAIAVLTLSAIAAHRAGLLGGGLNENHLHSLGKFLLAFFAFWAYMAFSQYMLTWIANLPHEAPLYLLRTRGGWQPVGVFLVLFHFIVPFFILLSRDLKRRPGPLAAMAVWALAVHYVDMYWVVMPAVHPERPRPSWMDLTALLGIGALALAVGAWRLRGRLPVPVGDPYLEDSLRYDPR